MDYVNNIKNSGNTIYDALSSERIAREFIPAKNLEDLLNDGMNGMNLSDYPIRTRSKVVKSKVCEILGYPVPHSFKKVQPRFPAQDLDVYTQKSLNLQIWNEAVMPSRRYALIRVDENNIVTKVRILTGRDLIEYDSTGTLTMKYHARVPSMEESCLFSAVYREKCHTKGIKNNNGG